MKTKRILTKAALIGCLVIASSAVSHAQVLVNVDFDTPAGDNGTTTANGAAVLGMSGDYWNNFGGNYALPSGTLSSSGGLVNSANTGTGITLSTTGSAGEYSDGGGSPTPGFLMTGYSFGNITLSLTGLTAYNGDTFTLELYGAGNQVGQGSTFTLSGSSTASDFTSGTTRTIATGPEDSYDTFTGTISGGTLGIDVTSNGSSQNIAIINGFQLELTPGEVVPEPSTWALMLAGVIGLVVFSRRKNVSQS